MTLSPDDATSPAPEPAPPPEQPTSPPSPPAAPRRRSPRRPPLFTGDPTPSPSAPSPPLDPPAHREGSASESPDAERAKDPGPGPRASSVSLTDRRQLKKALKAAVRTVGARLNALAEELERDAGVWIADEQDQEGMAEPASSLIARHSDLAVNPDVADALALLIAVADYASKHLDLKAKIRRLRKAGGAVLDQAGPMSEPPPAPPTGAAA